MDYQVKNDGGEITMLEKIMDAIGGRSRALAEQAEMIERLEAAVKDANAEKDRADADRRKVERLAKQSGDKMRERIKELTADNKELTSSLKKSDSEMAALRDELATTQESRDAIAESLAVAETEWKEMHGQHFSMTETLVAMEHRQAERQVELDAMTADRDRLMGVLQEIGDTLGIADETDGEGDDGKAGENLKD